MELINDAQALKIVMNIGRFYMKCDEFIVNLPKWFNDYGSNEYMKVHVQDHCFWFSSAIINDYLGRGRLITVDRVSSLKTIVKEITGNVHDDWPSKGLLVALNLSVKYTILYKIGVAKWAPSYSGSCFTPILASLLYQIGTMALFSFCVYFL